MSIPADQIVVPHQLCGYCDDFAAKMLSHCPTIDDLHGLEKARSDLLGELPSWIQVSFKHYPNLMALTLGFWERRCHLCAILFDTLRSQILRSTDQELVECRDTDELVRVVDGRLATGKVVFQSAVWYRSRVVDAGTNFFPWNIDMRLANTASSSEHWSTLVSLFLIDPTEETSTPADPDATLRTARSAARHASLCVATFSESHICLIKHWLNECASDHVRCRPLARPARPTRLLEIQSDSEMVRLVHGSAPRDAHYAALSYCWGQKNQLRLLPSNIKDLENGIPTLSLTKVAQDAVTVCQALSIRYLWLDALCIIQGPAGDFQREAARMEDVYGGSFVNIVAAAARDTTEGFLRSRNPLQWMDLQLQPRGRTREPYRRNVQASRFCIAEDSISESAKVNTRGWCFQERLLSPRSLFFGEKGLHWECRCGLACEQQLKITRDHSDYFQADLKGTYHDMKCLDPDLADPKTSKSFRRLWAGTLTKYSGTQLTHTKDRLIAIAGLAKSLQDKFSIKASYGLWLHDSVDELLWRVDEPRHSQTRVLDVAPSWSWANYQVRVLFAGLPSLGLRNCSVVETAVEVLALPRSNDFAIELEGSFSQSAAAISEFSTVRLRARVRRCRFRRSFSLGNWDLDPVKSSPDALGGTSYCFPEVAEELERDVFCILLRRRLDIPIDEEGVSVVRVSDDGLMLLPTDSSCQVYRRVGYFQNVTSLPDVQGTSGVAWVVSNMYLFPGNTDVGRQEIRIV